MVSLSVLGLLFGVLLSGLSYVQDSEESYSIAGSFAITTRNSSGTYLGGLSAPSANDVHLAESITDAVIYVMRSVRAVREIIEEGSLLGVSVSDIRSNLTISQEGSTQILYMKLTWPTAEEGLSIWKAVLDKGNVLIPQLLMIGQLEVINEPTASAITSGGSMKTMAVLLAVVGFMAGAGFAVMELLMRPTLTNVKDMETLFDLETLGIIPKDPEYFKKTTSILVKSAEGTTDVSQNYSSIAYILRNRLNPQEKHHCFYVTSSINREGRTTVVANLGIELSDMEHRTLLIDFDTRNPTLGSLFLNNIGYSRSLNALYRGEINEADAITTLTGYLDLLPMVIEHDKMISMDGVVVDLINQLKEQYEYIIIDAPPVGRESETLSLNQVVDFALFVVSYDNVTIPEIQASLEKLDKSGIRIIGGIINGSQTSNKYSLKVNDIKKTFKAKPKERKANLDETMDEHLNPSPEAEKGKLPPRKKKEPRAKKERVKKERVKKERVKKESGATEESGAIEKAEPIQLQSQPTVIRQARMNLMEELMLDDPSMSDNADINNAAITDELLRIGMENSRKGKNPNTEVWKEGIDD